VKRYDTHGILDDTLQKNSLAFRVRILHVVGVVVGTAIADSLVEVEVGSHRRVVAVASRHQGT
jgi:hypothetical protein